MRPMFILMLVVMGLRGFSQRMRVFTLGGVGVNVLIVDGVAREGMVRKFHGRQDDGLRKKWTARTWVLDDGRVVVEFFDGEGAVFASRKELGLTEGIRFVKVLIPGMKKTISYKIELSVGEGERIAERAGVTRLDSVTRGELNEGRSVYRLANGQLLYIDKSGAAVYGDMKALGMDCEDIKHNVYDSDDDDYFMKRLAGGDRLADYDDEFHLIYPKYLNALIKNHRLRLVERNVYVTEFYGNLYRSANGYYMLIDEVNQKNGAGDKMRILDLRIYDSLSQVRWAQARYVKYKDTPVRSEHFYQQISDRYGERFPQYVPGLVDSLPRLLNIDRVQFSMDSIGMDIVDEANHWVGVDNGNFDRSFPSLLAYYGQCYITNKHRGQWSMYLDAKANVWVPEVKLEDGSFAWDWIDFYKNLAEWPIPLRWAGNWQGWRPMGTGAAAPPAEAN